MELHLAITPSIGSWDIVPIFQIFHYITILGLPLNTDNFTTSSTRCNQMQLHANTYNDIYNTQVQTNVQTLHTYIQLKV